MLEAKTDKILNIYGNSLAVQGMWLSHGGFTSRVLGLIPDQGTQIPQAK